MAVVSLLTATAARGVASLGSPEHIAAALALALLQGLILLAMGIFRLGFVANLLSHPVISGFIAASSLLVAVSQLKRILRIEAQGRTMVEVAPSLIGNPGATHLPTLAIGATATAFLFLSRRYPKPSLRVLI